MTAPWALHWLDAEGSARPWQGVIEAEIAAAHGAIGRVTDLHPIDILIQSVPQGVPGLGLNGFSHRAALLTLTIDPSSPDREASLAAGMLRRLLAHEVHHCMRMREGQASRATLGASFITEGLADHFVLEVFGPPALPWTTPFTKAEWRVLRSGLPPIRDDTRTYQPRWMFGDKAADIPRSAGYRLGFALLGDYLAAHPEARPSRMAGMPADIILAESWPRLFSSPE